MDRKLIRPSLGAKRPEPASAAIRPVRPPTETRAETGYLVQAIESGAPFRIELLGGALLEGRLEGYDRDVLILAREGQPPLVVRKDRIRRYAAERVAPPAPATPEPTR